MLRSIREIGSEYWIEQAPEVFPEKRDGVYVFSGRTAIDLILQDILKKRLVKSVYMPAWCCDSMIVPFLAHGIEVLYFDVCLTDGSGIKCQEDITERVDILYLTNYFGYENTLPIETVKQFKEKGIIIIYDRTHSFMMEDEECLELADYHFVSIRKWMAVVGGAVVNGLTEKPILKECPYALIKEKAMREKWRYLQGDAGVVKEDFLKAFGEFGHHLADDYRDYTMDSLSYALYKQEDLLVLAKKRRENAIYLHKNLKNVRFIGQLTDKTVPLFVPVFFESKEIRDAVRKSLIDNQIYCPIHWPKPQQISSEFAVNQIVETELSIICDQRYGIEDMQRIVDTIREYFEIKK